MNALIERNHYFFKQSDGSVCAWEVDGTEALQSPSYIAAADTAGCQLPLTTKVVERPISFLAVN